MNGYGINLDRWNSLSEEDQGKLQAAFDTLIEEIWTYSEVLFEDAVNWSVGQTTKTSGMILLIIAAAFTLNVTLALGGVARTMTEWVAGLGLNCKLRWMFTLRQPPAMVLRPMAGARIAADGAEGS